MGKEHKRTIHRKIYAYSQQICSTLKNNFSDNFKFTAQRMNIISVVCIYLCVRIYTSYHYL